MTNSDETFEAPDVDELVGNAFPLHGPHDADHTVAAAAAMAELTRYLNYATGEDAKTGLPHPSDIGDLVDRLSVVASRLDQTIRQLVERLAVLRENQALFDHMRRDDPRAAGDRVDDATAALARAQLNGGLLDTALQDAHTALTRLGVRDTSPADTDA